MHNKNNNKTQTFIQGLRPFSSSIPKTLKKHLNKLKLDVIEANFQKVSLEEIFRTITSENNSK